METAYNILHLAGAACLVIFSATGFVFIFRWWDRLKIMETQIRFIFEIENELLLKSKGQTPMRSHFQKDFFKKGEDVVMPGAPPGFDMRHKGMTPDELSDYSTGNEPRGIIFKAERPIVVQDNPKSPPPPPLKKRVTEKSTTTETRNDISAPPKKTVSKKPPTKLTPKPKSEAPKK